MVAWRSINIYYSRDDGFGRHKLDLRSGSGGGLESARRIDGAKVKVRATNGWPCPGRALGEEGISPIR